MILLKNFKKFLLCINFLFSIHYHNVAGIVKQKKWIFVFYSYEIASGMSTPKHAHHICSFYEHMFIKKIIRAAIDTCYIF
jgi:hypothetical protein